MLLYELPRLAKYLTPEVSQRNSIKKNGKLMQCYISNDGPSALIDLNTVFEFISFPFIIHDGDIIFEANSAAAELFQVDNPEDLKYCSFQDFFIFAEDEDFEEHLQKVKEKNGAGILKARLKNSQSTEEDLELHTYYEKKASNYGEKILMQTIIHNIEERRLKEEQLIELDKLALMSTIAGGVAHDFNNFLAIMLGNITLCRKNIYNPVKLLPIVEGMEKSVMQAKDLACQLFSFTRDSISKKQVCSLDEQVQDLARFALSGTSATSEVIVKGKVPAVEVDESQIAQVVNNLLINAVQAMPGGGKIEIYLDNVWEGQYVEEIAAKAEKEYVRLSIKDEGVGMSREEMSQAFSPFFTTKREGTGLGLPIVASIVEMHGGFIDVNSKPGQGSTFTIYLPAVHEEVEYESLSSSDIYPGEGKILVMEDEPEVRYITGKMLSMLGYQPDFACDGQEAIEIYQEAKSQNSPYDLILMDVEIPGGLNGKETIKELTQIDPEVQVVVMSGHASEQKLANEEAFKEVKSFLGKPFKIEILSKVLYEVINGE